MTGLLDFLNPLFFDGCAVAFDLPILYWIQDTLKCAFMDFFMPFITLFGEGGIFWIGWAALLLLFPKHRKTGLAMGIALILGVLICNCFLKPAVFRLRPYDFIENFDMSTLLVHEHGDKSFPSGHTIASFEAAVVLLYYNKKMGIPAMILAVLVSFSRLYMFLHYPTDVSASIILGTLFARIGVWVMNKYYEKLPEKLRTLALPARNKE